MYTEVGILRQKKENFMGETIFSIFQDEHYIDLMIYQYGYEQCKPLHSFGPYVRNHWLFHYVISGKGTLRCNDEKNNTTEYRLEKGSGFLIEPGYVNTYWADKEDPWEYVWVEFGGLRAKKFLESAGLSCTHPIFYPDVPEHGNEVHREIEEIIRYETLSDAGQIGHLYLFMDKLVRYSTSRQRKQGGKLSEFYAKEAIAFIEQNYGSNITVEDIAHRCKLDRSYFGKVFKNVMGQSPQEFLIQYRMARAADELIITDESISAVGESVGYPNQLHFSRAFKSVYGVPPREYRQRNKTVK